MGMYQLEFPNDKSFCSMDPRLQFELRSADYRPDKSEIRLRSFNRTCSSQIECHLTARRQDERSIKVDLVARHAGALTKRVTRVLHKNEKASERHELCFDKLLDNGGEQEKEIGIGP